MANQMKEEKEKLTPAEYIEKLEREVNAAKALLWAAVKTAGGRVDIPDATMSSVDKTTVLASRYDSKRGATIIESKRDSSQLIKLNN